MSTQGDRQSVLRQPAGAGASALLSDLPLVPVRGQASWTEGGTLPSGAAWGGYAVPTRSGVLYGATHDRGETQTDVRAGDNDRNRAVLEAGLPILAGQVLQRLDSLHWANKLWDGSYILLRLVIRLCRLGY